MNALVLYDSQYGNTERVAQAIADALRAFGEARAIRIDPARPVELEEVDLLLIGSPTQGWNATKAMQSFLEGDTPRRLRGKAIACFDTRFHKPRWMTGSAAKVMAGKLQGMGFTLLAPPESFFVAHSEGPLEDGELERAGTWARMLANRVETPQPIG